MRISPRSTSCSAKACGTKMSASWSSGIRSALWRHAWAGRSRQVQVLRDGGGELACVAAAMDLFGARTGAQRLGRLLGIDVDPDRIGDDLRRRARPRRRGCPVTEVVGLQLDAVAVGVLVVEGGGEAVIEARVRLDPVRLQRPVARQQLLERLELE